MQKIELEKFEYDRKMREANEELVSQGLYPNRPDSKSENYEKELEKFYLELQRLRERHMLPEIPESMARKSK